MRWRVPVEISRDDLEALVDRSTVVLEREKHRLIHEGDWRRWGARGGRETLRRYGPGGSRCSPAGGGAGSALRSSRLRGCPSESVSRGGLEVTGPNIASKPPRIAFKARRGR